MKGLFFGILFSVTFCGCKPIAENPIDITIQYAESSRIDIKTSLNTGIYTVYFLSKDPISVEFDLNVKEREDIIRSKKSLLLDWEPTQTTIEDSCWHAPKLYTRVTINSKKGISIINIDDGCDNFYESNAGQAMRVKNFLKKIKDIIESKKEVKDAPESDWGYM